MRSGECGLEEGRRTKHNNGTRSVRRAPKPDAPLVLSKLSPSRTRVHGGTCDNELGPGLGIGHGKTASEDVDRLKTQVDFEAVQRSERPPNASLAIAVAD